ncbi:MAG: CHAT domain-containing protein [Symploca sp. SIO1A3]|nr:CHAT domain-containing protein [Symploca sp. SIO1A3]
MVSVYNQPSGISPKERGLVIEGTRITLCQILAYIRAGKQYQKIQEDFPQLTDKQIDAAMSFIEENYTELEAECQILVKENEETQQYKKLNKSSKFSIINSQFFLLPFALFFLSGTASAQPIVSDQSTSTVINSNGNQFDIEGGTLSGDGTNLFHSFSQFGLDNNETANFLANPSINNILGRITGGDASVINGLIQVTGGNSNLYLMNPAGMIFNSDAQLNVPAAFTATTATSIGFDGGWFNAVGTNNYSALVGSPNGFQFATSQPGAIINAAHLTVPAGQNLSLVGGTVVSTGSLTATDGNITVTAVPGTSLVRINGAGQILSLEIAPPTDSQGNPYPITPLMLPALLTGSNANVGTGITVNSQGEVELTGFGIGIEAGDVVANQLIADTLTLLAHNNLTLVESQLQTTGEMKLLAGDTVVVRDSPTNPVLFQAGGDLLIQGNQGIDILALNHPYQTPFVSGGNLSLVSDGTIYGDAHYASGGSFSILNLAGEGGNFVALFDPIISSTEDVIFGNYNGPSLKVETLGSITVTGDITIDNPDFILATFCAQNDCSDDAQILAQQPALILRAGLDELIEPAFGYPGDGFGQVPDNPNPIFDGTTFNSAGVVSSPGDVTVNGDITIGNNLDGPVFFTGPVMIEASGNITTGNINTFIDSLGSDVPDGGLVDLQAGGNITTDDINSSSLDRDGGAVNVQAGGSITTGNIDSSSSDGNSGAVNLESGGNIITGNIEAFSENEGDVTSGAVTLDADGNIIFQTIKTEATSGDGTATGGDVSITAEGVVRGLGTIDGTDNDTILTSGTTQGGSVTIQHNGGADNEQFIVGDATNNGTVGVIRTGDGDDEAILPNQTIPAPDTLIPDNNTFELGDPDTNGISITFINQAPTLTANPQLSDTQENQPLTFTFADLSAFITDVNGDNTSIEIKAIPAGTLTRNGIALGAGDTINPGDTLIYTPAAGNTGLINAFEISASDRVSSSASQTVSLNVTPEPPTPPAPEPPTPPAPEPPTLPAPEPPTLPAPEPPTPPAPEPPTPPAPDDVLPEPIFPPNDFPKLVPVENLQPMEANLSLAEIDEGFTRRFEQYLGEDTDIPIKSLDEAREILGEVAEATGVKPALLYITFFPSDLEASQFKVLPQPDDELELVVVSPDGQPIRRRVGITRKQVLYMTGLLHRNITNVREPRRYLNPAQKLYQWLIAPIEANLQAQGIDNLVFIMDSGLRSLPMAALHDGNGFIVEKYSVGLMPSLSLTDTRYVNVQNLEVLGMGANTFTDQEPLPAVPLELELITSKLWSGKSFLNDDFTIDNLRKIRSSKPFGIIHLATHGQFLPGKLNNSYIQFGNKKLGLDQLGELGLNKPPVELLVLSACRTALGDEEAELGFAGLAVQAGVKSALGSLWYVSDEGTMGLMTSFYEQLKTAPIKAEAIRQAQLAMIKGEVRLEGGQLVTSNRSYPLFSELQQFEDRELSHPYYWSAFTMIGNPW